MKYSLFVLFFLISSSPLALAETAIAVENPETATEKSQLPAPNPQEPTVFERKIHRDAAEVYKQLFTALENNGYFVVFETNIGKNLSRFEQRWGEDYNKNKLESIRSMIFCNGWYANQVSNHDPKMLALCPMHITLVTKNGITSVLYVRPGVVAKDSPAKNIAEEMEQDIVRIINSIS